MRPCRRASLAAAACHLRRCQHVGVRDSAENRHYLFGDVFAGVRLAACIASAEPGAGDQGYFAGPELQVVRRTRRQAHYLCRRCPAGLSCRRSGAPCRTRGGHRLDNQGVGQHPERTRVATRSVCVTGWTGLPSARCWPTMSKPRAFHGMTSRCRRLTSRTAVSTLKTACTMRSKRAGEMVRLTSDAAIDAARLQAPPTRAAIRGLLVSRFADKIGSVSWNRVILRTEAESWMANLDQYLTPDDVTPLMERLVDAPHHRRSDQGLPRRRRIAR